MRSKSASRALGLFGTAPTTYGRPLRVGAGFHVFPVPLLFPGERREGIDMSRVRKRGLELFCRREARYSEGTNSSNKMSVLSVRGSADGVVGEAFCET